MAGSSPATSAQIDADGYVTIVGRSKDLIISGGYNIYPKEVESLIDDIPGVVESAVFGLPDADAGECVVVAVVLDPKGGLTPQAIQDRHCAAAGALQAAAANPCGDGAAAQHDG